MIKLRVTGEDAELRAFVTHLAQAMPGWRVMEVSRPYASRGSVYERVYVEIETLGAAAAAPGEPAIKEVWSGDSTHCTQCVESPVPLTRPRVL